MNRAALYLLCATLAVVSALYGNWVAAIANAAACAGLLCVGHQDTPSEGAAE